MDDSVIDRRVILGGNPTGGTTGVEMKRPKQRLEQDVEELVEKSVVEEAVQKVFVQLDEALRSLDTQSEALVREFLEGVSVSELARHHDISEEKAQQWLTGAKRSLAQELPSRCKVKQ